jgi:hypothetical protein
MASDLLIEIFDFENSLVCNPPPLPPWPPMKWTSPGGCTQKHVLYTHTFSMHMWQDTCKPVNILAYTSICTRQTSYCSLVSVALAAMPWDQPIKTPFPYLTGGINPLICSPPPPTGSILGVHTPLRVIYTLQDQSWECIHPTGSYAPHRINPRSAHTPLDKYYEGTHPTGSYTPHRINPRSAHTPQDQSLAVHLRPPQDRSMECIPSP